MPPVDTADRSPRVAMRRGAALARPLLSYVGIELLLLVVSVLFVLPFAAGRIDPDTVDERGALALLVPAQLVAVLLTTFVTLVPQRIGLEGDPRVLVAAAHSVRVARTAFGPMFAVSLVRVAPGLAAAALVAYDRPVVTRVAVALVAIPIEMVAAATLTEIYLRGPRLDVPAEFTSRRR